MHRLIFEVESLKDAAGVELSSLEIVHQQVLNLSDQASCFHVIINLR